MNPWRCGLAISDAVSVGVSMLLAATMQYSGAVPPTAWEALGLAIPITAIVLVCANHAFGLYNRVWRYAGAETAAAIVASVGITFVVSGIGMRFLAAPLPPLLWYAAGMAVLSWVGGIRLAWRLIRPLLATAGSTRNGGPRRVIVYGAGGDGYALSRVLGAIAGGGHRIVGYVDDDPQKLGLLIGSARVLGTGAELGRIVAQTGAQEVLIALWTADKQKLRDIYVTCREAGVRAMKVPPLLELIETPTMSPHDVQVDDLLQRNIAEGSIDLHDNYVQGKTVLVTGAGGSIGSELCRQICRYSPKRLLLLGRGENRIHWIYQHLKQAHPEIDIVPIIANVTVESAMRRVFAAYRPDIVFHTAAHKHVYLMEPAASEAARNNILGTALLADLAEEHRTSKFVFLSTDKAVEPSSVMGCTKRVGELLLAHRDAPTVDFVCVLFGNVLGSEGSVLEIFRRQLQRGASLTVTHPDATRYFMSIPEACFLVLQAGAIGSHGDLFVLDMGEPVRIMELASDFIMLSGGDPHAPGAIRVIGLQPGEKLHERLNYSDETVEHTLDPYILRIRNGCAKLSPARIREQVGRIAASVAAEDDGQVMQVLLSLTEVAK